MIRGVEGRCIFLGEEDRRDFVTRLERLLPEARWQCFAWALMLYVHRNPLAAGRVGSLEALERDPWCGHGALVGTRRPRCFESVAATRSLFAEQPEPARRCIREWMRDPGTRVPADSLDGPPDPNTGVMPRSALSCEVDVGRGTDSPRRRIDLRPGGHPGEQLRALLLGVSQWLGVPVADICSASPRRGPARARAAVAYLAFEELGIRGQTTATALRISPSAVSHALRRGRLVVDEERMVVAYAPGGGGKNEDEEGKGCHGKRPREAWLPGAACDRAGGGGPFIVTSGS